VVGTAPLFGTRVGTGSSVVMCGLDRAVGHRAEVAAGAA
jgi:hypothetical protein